jgi:hypothetical protein
MTMNKMMFLLLGALLLFSSCNFSKGVKKDLGTGLSASYNGFSVEDIYLVSANQKLGSNTIAMGTKIAIVASGVENFTEKNGKVFPGCSILLTDKSGKEILNLPDAFADMVNGTTAAEAKALQASLTTGNPMMAGETYHLKARFYDKNKKESEIVANVDLLMK